MKRLPAVLAAVLALASSPLVAERADQGTAEIGGAFVYDTDTPAGDTLRLDLLGGEFSLANDDNAKLFALSATLERDFEVGDADSITPLIPYLGAALGYASADYKEHDSESGIVLGLRAGLKVMLTGSLALDFSVHANFASADVYFDDDGPSSSDIALRIGLRTFLF